MAATQNVLFMGTPGVAARCLELLEADKRINVCAVVTQPDKLAGRKKQLTPPPVKKSAQTINQDRLAEGQAGLEILQPASLKNPEAQQSIAQLHHQTPFDYAVVCAYGQLIPRSIFTLPAYDTVNIHFSLLPRWRGASPVEAALWHGDAQTGISVQFITDGLDEGDVLFSLPQAIEPDAHAGSLMHTLTGRLDETVEKIVGLFQAGRPEAVPQDHGQATHCRKIDTHAGLIDWTQPAPAIYNQIRALAIRPGSFTFYRGRRIKITSAALPTTPKGQTLQESGKIKPVKGAPAHFDANALISMLSTTKPSSEPLPVVPGQILGTVGEAAAIQTGVGILLIDGLKPEGKKEMTGLGFLNGQAITWNHLFSLTDQ